MEVDDGIDVYLFMTEGVMVAADDVHHIIPLKDNWELRATINNLISLSHDTHSMIEQKYRTEKDNTIKLLQKMVSEYREMYTGGT